LEPEDRTAEQAAAMCHNTAACTFSRQHSSGKPDQLKLLWYSPSEQVLAPYESAMAPMLSKSRRKEELLP
jgi:hypothetical protein